MKSGTKLLKVVSILEIIVGILALLAIVGLLSVKPLNFNLSEKVLDGAFLQLLYLYGYYFLCIVAGIVGLIKAKEKSLLTVILGIIILLGQGIHFAVGNSFEDNIANTIALIIPALYLSGAVMNYRNIKDEKTEN